MAPAGSEDKREEALVEWRASLKENIDEQVLKAYFPRLKLLGRDNEIDKICKEMYPRYDPRMTKPVSRYATS